MFGDGFEVGQDNVWEHTTCNEAHDLITPRCDRLQKKCIVETKKVRYERSRRRLRFQQSSTTRAYLILLLKIPKKKKEDYDPLESNTGCSENLFVRVSTTAVQAVEEVTISQSVVSAHKR